MLFLQRKAMKTAAGFVIYRRDGEKIKYLLLQTSYGEHHWTPPKGHVDPGESDLETAYRETHEEAGLSKEDFNVDLESKKELNYLVNGKQKRVVYWLAELVNEKTPVKLSDEHIDFKWLELKEACEYGKFDDMQSMLRAYEDYLKAKHGKK